MNLTEVSHHHLAKPLLVIVLTSCVCGYYLPWTWTSFLLLPLYFFAWLERDKYRIEEGLRIALVLFLAYLVLFSLTSAVPMLSFKGGYDVLRGVLLFPVGVAFAGWVKDQRSWGCVNLVALLLVLGSLLKPQVLEGEVFYSYFVNPNNAAVLLVVLLCFLYPAINLKKTTWRQPLSLIGLPTALYLLYLTNGRGAWLGVSAALLVIALVRTHVAWRYRLLACAGIIAGLATLLIKYNWKGFRLSHREELWSGLFHATLKKHLFLGYGFNGTKDLIDHLGLITRTAHNIFLEIFVTSGLLGLAFMLFFLVYLWRIFSRYSYPNNHIFLSGITAVIAFAVMGQFDLKFSSFRFMATISFFLGMIYSQRTVKGTAGDGLDNN